MIFLNISAADGNKAESMMQIRNQIFRDLINYCCYIRIFWKKNHKSLIIVILVDKANLVKLYYFLGD